MVKKDKLKRAGVRNYIIYISSHPKKITHYCCKKGE